MTGWCVIMLLDGAHRLTFPMPNEHTAESLVGAYVDALDSEREIISVGTHTAVRVDAITALYVVRPQDEAPQTWWERRISTIVRRVTMKTGALLIMVAWLATACGNAAPATNEAKCKSIGGTYSAATKNCQLQAE